MDKDQDRQQFSPKQQVAERIKQATNVLVTVKSNPSIDELAATIGLTIMVNKLGKHGTAVFSGEVPSTLEFLRPEDTIETNTNSLRDFIVSLDKSKADKLRYKVEENVVKIFITPYRTSITEDDLEFTQGDFNVDVVIALGVTQREELDQVITAHGRILHDATFITITSGQDYSELGQINWQEPAASSLSEMLVSISEALQGGIIDEQIATAFLTGIVAETERFSNTKTTPKVMTMSAQLMAAGANQQLIANELEKAVDIPLDASNDENDSNEQTNTAGVTLSEDGTLSISHEDDKKTLEQLEAEKAEKPRENSQDNIPQELPEVSTQSSILNDDDSASKGYSKFLAPEEPVKEAESYNPLLSDSQQNKTADQDDIENSDKNKDVKVEDANPPEGDQENNRHLLPSEDPSVQSGNASHADNKTQLKEDDGQIHIDTEGNLIRNAAVSPKHKVIQPLGDSNEATQSLPSLESVTGANASSDNDEDSKPSVLPPPPPLDLTPSPPIKDETTLLEIEKSVDSPHLQFQPEPPVIHPTVGGSLESNSPTPGVENVDSARDAVMSALSQSDFSNDSQPRSDLNALPLSAPPETSSLDSYRLPDDNKLNSVVTDVSGNLPDTSLSLPPLPGSEQQGNGQDDGGQMTPPPVPPPMFPQ